MGIAKLGRNRSFNDIWSRDLSSLYNVLHNAPESVKWTESDPRADISL